MKVFVWLLTPNDLIFLGFEGVDPSSISVVLVGIDEHDALEGSYFEILGVLECLKELEKTWSSPPSGYWTICSIFSALYSMDGTGKNSVILENQLHSTWFS